MKEKILNMLPWVGMGIILYFVIETLSNRVTVTEPIPVPNDTATTVVETKCIIYVKDYTEYKDFIDPVYIIPNYDPPGYLIDTCRGVNKF